jgi:outer membrane protein assembly factor BamA
VLGVDYNKRNSEFYPSKGYYWTTKVSGLTGLNVSDHTSASIVSTFNFYLHLDGDSKFVIADRTGAGLFFGTGEFFQMMNLGGPLSLQGYHTSRFIGDQILFNNLELRIKLFDFNNYIMAGKMGAIAYNDVGRVWLNGESSNTVHDAFGGGLFIVPYNKVILSAVLGHSITDGQLLYLAAGFRF